MGAAIVNGGRFCGSKSCPTFGKYAATSGADGAKGRDGKVEVGVPSSFASSTERSTAEPISEHPGLLQQDDVISGERKKECDRGVPRVRVRGQDGP